LRQSWSPRSPVRSAHPTLAVFFVRSSCASVHGLAHPPPPLCATAPPSLRRTLRGDPRPPSPLAPPSGSPRSVKSRPEFVRLASILVLIPLSGRRSPKQYTHSLTPSRTVGIASQLRVPPQAKYPAPHFFLHWSFFSFRIFIRPLSPSLIPSGYSLYGLIPALPSFSLAFHSPIIPSKHRDSKNMFSKQFQFFSQPSLYTCQFV